MIVTFPYHLPTRRLILSLLLPPLWGTVAITLMILVSAPGTYADDGTSPLTTFFMFYLAGALFCMVPGVACWQVFEVIWNKYVGWTDRWWVYTGIGALLGFIVGLIAGFLIGLYAGSWALVMFTAPSLLGAFAGFLTSWCCLRISRSRAG